MTTKIYIIREENVWGIPVYLLCGEQIHFKLHYIHNSVNIEMAYCEKNNICIYDFYCSYKIFDDKIINNINEIIEQFINPYLMKNITFIFTYNNFVALKYLKIIIKKTKLKIVLLDDSIYHIEKVLYFLVRKNPLIFADSIKNENTIIANVFNNLKREIITFL